jgi:tetratricopeptide (TPR) repeat protein
MARQRHKQDRSQHRFELSVPLMILIAFALGAGSTWLIMRSSSSERQRPAIESFLPPQTGQAAVSGVQSAPASEPPPDVSQLSPADAEKTLADWNYDRRDWQHAIDHYKQAIARGADTPDVRTDMGNCYRFLNQPQQALEQYKIAQNQNPQHENSLFNQISLYSQLLNDPESARKVAADFLARFPNSPRTDAVKKQLTAIGSAAQPR